MKPLPPATRAAILAEIRQGLLYDDICEHFQVSKNCVSKIAIKAGMRRLKRPPALSDSQAARVIARYQAGEQAAVIGESFGMSADVVWETLRRAGLKARDVSACHVRHPLRHDALDALTPEAAYWCGIFFTDGSVTRQGDRSPEVAVVLQKGDRDHLVKLRDFLGSTHAITPIKPAVAKISGGQGAGAFRYAVRSRPLAERLLSLGRYGPAPDPELAASRDFWRGCVDGDGTVCISRGRVCVKLNGSQWLLQAFVDFLGPIGSRRALHVRPARSIFVVGAGDGTAIKITRLLYDGASVALDRKMEIAEKVLAMR